MRCFDQWRYALGVVALAFVAVLAPSDPRAEGRPGGETSLAFRVERGVPPDVTIEDVCCAGTYRFDSQEAERISLGFGEDVLWMRIELPSTAGLVQLTPILDDVTMHARLRDGTWRAVRTGDQIPTGERLFASPFMVLPIPQEIAQSTVYVRIVQSSAVTIGATLWELPSFVAMQAADQVMKTFLFGFICAMILFNSVVSILVRDLAFLLNACTIAGILLVALYLSGYGAVYFWPSLPGWSNFFLAAGLTATLVAGSCFMWVFVRDPGEAAIHGWPLLGAGVSAALAFAAFALLPFHVVNFWLLASVAALLVGGTLLLLRRALRGDRRARILLFPWLLAMVPGTVLVALDKLLGIRPLTVNDNLLEVTLCLEAVLFSLALTSRIRLAEGAARDAAARMLALRDESAARALEAQDAERRRLATELHDGAGQSFLFVLNSLRRLARSPTTLETGTLASLADTTASALGELRRISRDMHPSAIEHLGLVGALESMIAHLESNGIDTEAKIGIDEDVFSADAKLHIYRVTQECFTNIVRHAEADHVRIALEMRRGVLHMAIEDNGVGIRDAISAAGVNGGLGFSSIAERVRTLGGRWTMNESELGGLAIEVRIPVAEVSS